ncbi:MAG: SPOR domain-containing protein [Sphingomonas sp.]|nr:SPOR domain-containing protein [Sphingomonas sp.]
MSDSRAVAAIDRLPWLQDEPPKAARSALPGLWRWSIPALLLVAGISFWLGSRSVKQFDFGAPAAEQSATRPPATTATLPEPQVPDVAEQPSAISEVTVAPTAPVARPAPPTVRHGRAVTRRPAAAKATAPAPPKKAVNGSSRVEYWPARKSTGALGRMVRIGTFESAAQAKTGWRKVMGIYPGMSRIRTVVVPVRSLRNGRTYYRLQMGTTSQAHSEVLCQRMRVIGQSCIVLGLSQSARSVK